VYTFAEDYVFGSGLALLTSGNKCFASRFSMMGDVGYTMKTYGVKHFLEDWDL